jgi:hypothetical protein
VIFGGSVVRRCAVFVLAFRRTGGTAPQHFHFPSKPIFGRTNRSVGHYHKNWGTRGVPQKARVVCHTCASVACGWSCFGCGTSGSDAHNRGRVVTTCRYGSTQVHTHNITTHNKLNTKYVSTSVNLRFGVISWVRSLRLSWGTASVQSRFRFCFRPLLKYRNPHRLKN